MSSMEDREALSDRALSSCSCSWLAAATAALFCRGGKVSVLRRFLVDRPGRALTCDRRAVRFFCMLLAVLLRGLAELP